MVIAYLDASAIVKLVRRETGSDGLREFLRACDLVASEVAVTEVLRAVMREASVVGQSTGELLERALSAMEELVLIVAQTTTFVRAGLLDGAHLRSLDAIHIATAVEVGGVDVFVTYDERQAAAVRIAGFRTIAPGV